MKNVITIHSTNYKSYKYGNIFNLIHLFSFYSTPKCTYLNVFCLLFLGHHCSTRIQSCKNIYTRNYSRDNPMVSTKSLPAAQQRWFDKMASRLAGKVHSRLRSKSPHSVSMQFRCSYHLLLKPLILLSISSPLVLVAAMRFPAKYKDNLLF